jgi:hypothetical protein
VQIPSPSKIIGEYNIKLYFKVAVPQEGGELDTDPQLITTPDPQLMTTPDPQLMTTPDPQLMTTPDPQFMTTPDPQLMTTLDPTSCHPSLLMSSVLNSNCDR